MRHARLALVVCSMVSIAAFAGELAPPGGPAPSMPNLQAIYDQVSETNQAVGGGQSLLFFPHIIEQQGSINSSQDTFDTMFSMLATQGYLDHGLHEGTSYAGGSSDAISVDLYLYGQDGQPAKSATDAEVAFPATFALGGGTAKVNVTLENLFQAAGGFASPLFIGFAVLRVSTGDWNDVAVEAFTLNAHSNPFDLTIVDNAPIRIQDTSAAKGAAAEEKK